MGNQIDLPNSGKNTLKKPSLIGVNMVLSSSFSTFSAFGMPKLLLLHGNIFVSTLIDN